jgi:alpha-beta hydrolase superfamily lysophospholipase
MRHLAERAAVAGVPTLRFDYAGTGDSVGNDFDPDRLGAWVASIQAAADTLREKTGVTRLCLLGTRLGATLAALAIEARSDVVALIAIAPVVNGKSYVRELRMLQRASEAKQNTAPAAASAETIETAGFTLFAATHAALSGIDLTRRTTPLARALILDRAELPGGERWEQHLLTSGCSTERVCVAGYTEMMLDSHESIIPQEILGAALKWLSDRRDESEESTNISAVRAERERIEPTDTQHAAVPPPVATDPAAGMEPAIAVEETVARFGADGILFGIVTAPMPRASVGFLKGRGIVLLNSGGQSHVGPGRLYVTLARYLARRGHVILRMDIAGIGESPPRPGDEENVVYPRHAGDDVQAAIAYLREKWGRQDVRAAGLCSGAYHAFKAAAAGMPLSGVVLINPLTFFWKEGMSLKYPEHRVAADIMRYRVNIWRPASWRKLLSGRVNLWESAQVLFRRARTVALAPLRDAVHALRAPLPDDLRGELSSIVRAGIDLQFVFSANDPGAELLQEQGGAVARKLRASGAFRVETIEGADHTFTNPVKRAALVKVLEQALCG